MTTLYLHNIAHTDGSKWTAKSWKQDALPNRAGSQIVSQTYISDVDSTQGETLTGYFGSEGVIDHIAILNHSLEQTDTFDMYLYTTSSIVSTFTLALSGTDLSIGHTAHGLGVGDMIGLTGIEDSDGVEISGLVAEITSVTDANNYVVDWEYATAPVAITDVDEELHVLTETYASTGVVPYAAESMPGEYDNIPLSTYHDVAGSPSAQWIRIDAQGLDATQALSIGTIFAGPAYVPTTDVSTEDFGYGIEQENTVYRTEGGVEWLSPGVPRRTVRFTFNKLEEEETFLTLFHFDRTKGAATGVLLIPSNNTYPQHQNVYGRLRAETSFNRLETSNETYMKDYTVRELL